MVTIDKLGCWNDSLTAIYWIRGTDKECRTFVENRVKEIRSLVAPEMWDHCPGPENPTDIPSRGMNPTKLSESEKWFHGPEWLLLSEKQWPSTTDDSESTSAAEEELRRSRAKITVLLSTVFSLFMIIDCARFM